MVAYNVMMQAKENGEKRDNVENAGRISARCGAKRKIVLRNRVYQDVN